MSRRADVRLLLTSNAATYRFRDIRCQMAKIWDFGIHLGYRPQKERRCVRNRYVGYYHAKFYANRCHHRQDICNQTKYTKQMIISDKSHTSVVFVDKNRPKWIFRRSPQRSAYLATDKLKSLQLWLWV